MLIQITKQNISEYVLRNKPVPKNHILNILDAPEKISTCADYYKSVRKRSVELCTPLSTEDFVVQPVTDVSPPKWHLAHITWFFENFILVPHMSGYKVFNDSYNYLFNSYYESVGKKALRTNRGNLTRPSVDEIMRYRQYVDKYLIEFLENERKLIPSLKYLLQLGLNHEEQHQELLLTDIKYILGNNPLFPEYSKSKNRKEEPVKELSFTEIKEGLYPIGYSGNGFCFDNERGHHIVFLHNYRIANRLINNGEYLEFMKDGAYDNFRYWLSDGWDWVKNNQVKAPEYWHKINNHWHSYTLSGLQKIRPNDPVTHVSFYEADAFARWKRLRLPTEFEWETACNIISPEIPGSANFAETGNYEPVNSRKNPQFYGDAWEWTNSAYLPYPFYKQEAGALGEYNGKFMINQMVLRGGSCATPKRHIRRTYRNFFQPDKRWQFTGIRLAQTIE